MSSQTDQDPWEELVTLKVFLAGAAIFLPGILVTMSSTAAQWCLDHGLLVTADQAAVRLPQVVPAVGLDVPRIVIAVIVVVAVVLSCIQYAVSVRRARLRRMLREANRL